MGVLEQFAERRGIKIPLLSDSDTAVIKAFGVLNAAYGIAHPGIFVIGGDGVITHFFAEQNYQDRPTIESVLGALKKSGS